MADSRNLCCVCTLRQVSKSSVVWCTECDEGLCTECQEHHSLSKSSRNHTTIPVTEYQKLPSDILNISQYCKIHNEKYIIYCKKHESLCCSDCVVESHNECRDIVKLAEVIKNAKSSNAFYEMEQNLVDVLENINKVRENRQQNLKTLSKERAAIECEIEHTRITINKHLDKIKNDIMRELNEVEKRESNEICQLINMLEEKQNQIADCQKKISSIKQNATDLQAFFAMKQLEKDVFLKEEFLQSLVDKNTIKQYSLIYQSNATLQNFVSNMSTFGQVKIETTQLDVVLIGHKRRQAQITVPKVRSKSLEEINLELHKQINGTGEDIYGCCVLPGGKIALTNYHKGVKILKKDGSFDSNVRLPKFSFDLEYVSKDDTLVVTSDSSRYVTIINMKDRQMKKRISLDSVTHGIAGTGYGIIYSGRERGVCIINLPDETVRQIVRERASDSSYIAAFANNIYQTNPIENSVTCFDFNGAKQWTFNNAAVLNYPLGISVDNNGNIFVVGNHSKNVVLISADGKRHREVLSSKNGLSNPWSIHYDRSTNQLLVANTRQTAFIYNSI